MSAGEAKRKKDSEAQPGNRTGRWTRAEQTYMEALIKDFKDGIADVANGQTLRQFLALQLDCKEKRVSKRMENTNYHGRQTFVRKAFPEHEIKERRTRLGLLKQAFKKSIEPISLEALMAMTATQTEIESLGKRKAEEGHEDPRLSVPPALATSACPSLCLPRPAQVPPPPKTLLDSWAGSNGQPQNPQVQQAQVIAPIAASMTSSAQDGPQLVQCLEQPEPNVQALLDLLAGSNGQPQNPQVQQVQGTTPLPVPSMASGPQGAQQGQIFLMGSGWANSASGQPQILQVQGTANLGMASGAQPVHWSQALQQVFPGSGLVGSSGQPQFPQAQSTTAPSMASGTQNEQLSLALQQVLLGSGPAGSSGQPQIPQAHCTTTPSVASGTQNEQLSLALQQVLFGSGPAGSSGQPQIPQAHCTTQSAVSEPNLSAGQGWNLAANGQYPPAPPPQVQRSPAPAPQDRQTLLFGLNPNLATNGQQQGDLQVPQELMNSLTALLTESFVANSSVNEPARKRSRTS